MKTNHVVEYQQGGENMKKILTLCFLSSILLLNNAAFASSPTYKTYAQKVEKKYENVREHDTHGVNGKVTPKSIGAGALSLIVWPGIGQLMNDGDNERKAAAHAIIGFFVPFRIWSCYDGVVSRKGGVWDNRI